MSFYRHLSNLAVMRRSVIKPETDKKSSKMEEEEIVINGGISVTRKFIKWKLNNFADFFVYKELIKQQKIEFDITDSRGVKSKWMSWLDFCPLEEENRLIPNEDTRQYLTLFICLVTKIDALGRGGVGTPYINAQIVPIVEGNGVQIFVGAAGEDAKYEPGLHWHWSIEELEMNSAISRHLPTQGDSLDITLEIAILEGQFSNATTSRVELAAKTLTERKEAIHQMISNFENDEAHSDVKIVSKNGQEFFAYSWMLAGVSDVFEAMFRVDMMEKDTGAVKFKDLTGNAVKILLHFVYSGTMCPEWVNPGTPEEIIYAADKYQIMKLKDFLDSEVGNVCTMDNASSLLHLASQTGLQKAEADILKFMKENMTDYKTCLEIMHNLVNNSIELSDQNLNTEETNNERQDYGEFPKFENEQEQNDQNDDNEIAMEEDSTGDVQFLGFLHSPESSVDVEIINHGVVEDRPGTSRPSASLNSLAECSSKRRRRTLKNSEPNGSQNDANVGGNWLRQCRQLQPPPPPAHSRPETVVLSYQRRPLGVRAQPSPTPNLSGQPYPIRDGSAHTQPRQDQNLEHSNSVNVLGQGQAQGHPDGPRRSPGSPLDLAGRGQSK